MRNRVGSLLTALVFALFCVAVMLTALYYVGTDAELYYELQMEAGILGEAGISEADLRTLDGALSRCLEGRKDWNSVTGPDGETDRLRVDVFGKNQPAFNAREIAHMQDCQNLFRKLRSVVLFGVTAAVLPFVFVNTICMTKNRRWAIGSLCAGAGVVFVPLALFALWAAIDFGAAFAFFHKVLFTNDLWLLNPETDLLIRICPQSMFAAMGVRVGLYSLAGIVALPLLAWGILRYGVKMNAVKRKFYNEIGL